MKAVLLTSSILILLLAALRPILRGRIDPRMQYALWLVVALRLLLPVELATSAYSALALLERAEEPARVVQAIGQTAVPISPMSYEDAYAQALREYEQSQPAATSFTDLERVEARARELTAHSPTLSELADRYARPVWLGGAALAGLWFALVNLRLRRKLRHAEPVEAEGSCSVFVSDALPSPCLCGVLRPRIYVTPAALGSPDRLRHVLAHELTHYHHRDHWWALVRCACLCVYWFDPLVWWAAALARQDCELACDAGAVRRLGEEERIPYGRTLVDMIAAGHTTLLQTATTMTGGRRRVRERIRLIARKPKTALAAALAMTVIVVCAVGCTFTGAPEASAPGPDTGTSLASDAPQPTVDTLQTRLLDLPEELRADVTAVAPDPGDVFDDVRTVATYVFNCPGEELDMSRYLLIVSQVSLERGEQMYGGGSSGLGGRLAARGADCYYLFQWNTSIEYDYERDAERFGNAQRAVVDFAEREILSTRGTESLNRPADTLAERLQTVPDELWTDVTLYPSDDPDHLAFYLLDNAGGWEGWLLTVCRWDQARFEEEWLYSVDTGTYEVFARDSEHYYAFMGPTSVQHSEEDTARYDAAAQAIRDYASRQVLSTEGVEPYDPTELRDQEYLWEGKPYTDVAYWPYKNVDGNTDIVWLLRLVQLAEEGENGVWIPERWQCIDPEVDPTPQHIKPDTGGLTVTAYARQLQAEADAGRADWATDPIQVCLRYAGTSFAHSNATADCFTRDEGYIRGVVGG